jgi:hypothetical protein
MAAADIAEFVTPGEVVARLSSLHTGWWREVTLEMELAGLADFEAKSAEWAARATTPAYLEVQMPRITFGGRDARGPTAPRAGLAPATNLVSAASPQPRTGSYIPTTVILQQKQADARRRTTDDGHADRPLRIKRRASENPPSRAAARSPGPRCAAGWG